LSLTAVENLADACLVASGWPPGAYNIADPVPYRRDAAVRAVLRAHGVAARVHHLPLVVARGAAVAGEALGRLRPHAEPPLTRYAVDQLAHSVVLDVSRAVGQGWTPSRTLHDYLAGVGRTPGRR
ncbi:MAG: NAD(P)-dependent oxidoreductase, partial [Actinomycetia bacterium]|nr:NAD(P)-dependent oxidoreductase [Actinomycetes bacterium]